MAGLENAPEEPVSGNSATANVCIPRTERLV